MDPHSGRALLYTMPTSIHILHWRDGNRRSTISIEPDDFDLGVRIVSFTRRSYPHHTRPISVERNHIPALLRSLHSVLQASLRGSISRPYRYPSGRSLAHASPSIRSSLLSSRVPLPRTCVPSFIGRHLHHLLARQRRLPRHVPLPHSRDHRTRAFLVCSRPCQRYYPAASAYVRD